MEKHTFCNQQRDQMILVSRSYIEQESFIFRHRRSKKDFTRKRSLTFARVMLFMIQKSLKSLQLRLNEFMEQWENGERVGISAWSQARVKLRHTAFIELNEKAILEVIYSEKDRASLKLWHGHRLLTVDSSLIRLPQSLELREAFRVVETRNQQGECGIGYPEGRVSVLYDVLNRISLDGILVNSQQGELTTALDHLVRLDSRDVVLTDRGYPSFRWFAEILKRGANFICRCSSNSFLEAQELFDANRDGVSKTVRLYASKRVRSKLQELGLPSSIVVRFISVRLSTGELEVLVTSLLDSEIYPVSLFGEVYHQRWGIETYYHLLKGRLDLENFSGKSVESVQQDFHSTIFVSNAETMLTRPLAEPLSQISTQRKYPVQINRAVSFHTLKSHALDLFFSKIPTEEVIWKLQELFLGNLVSVRPKRQVPRKKMSAWSSLHYQKRIKKIVF